MSDRPPYSTTEICIYILSQSLLYNCCILVHSTKNRSFPNRKVPSWKIYAKITTLLCLLYRVSKKFHWTWSSINLLHSGHRNFKKQMLVWWIPSIHTCIFGHWYPWYLVLYFPRSSRDYHPGIPVPFAKPDFSCHLFLYLFSLVDSLFACYHVHLSDIVRNVIADRRRFGRL